MPQPFYLDCDTGIDDALTIAYLLASPDVDLVGIGCVSGNTDAATAARNTLDLLSLMGRSDIPVAVGGRDFLDHPYDGGAPHVHGDNGIGGVTLPPSTASTVAETAAQQLVRLAREHAGQLRVVAIGPLTNLALALRTDPELPALVADLTIMGGAALVPGNVSAVAEANIANDPLAAHEVLTAPWDVTLVPLDVTLDHTLEVEHLAALREAGTPTTQALAQMLEFYFAFYATRYGRPCAALHDPLAAAIAEGGARTSSAPRVDVVVDATDGPGRGQTIVDLRGLGVGALVPGPTRVVLAAQEGFADVLAARLVQW